MRRFALLLCLFMCACRPSWKQIRAWEAEERYHWLMEQSVDMRVGMSSDEVTTLLGKPNEKAGRMCGAKSGEPEWKCVTWDYVAYRQFRESHFIVIFQENAAGKLVVLHWEML